MICTSGTTWATSGISSQSTPTLREWSSSPPWRQRTSHSMQLRLNDVFLFQINLLNISKIFQIYLLNISKIFVKYFPVPPREEHVRMGSPAPKHPPLQEIKHNDLINNAINHIIIMDTKNNIKYQEHDNDLILNSSPSEPNSGRRQVCPCTWWSISLRLLDKVPISFLQGHI